RARGRSPAAASTPPRPTRTASLRSSVPKPSKTSDPVAGSDFWVPDVSSLLIPAVSVAMLAIPLAELNQAKDSNLIVWSPPPLPSGDPPGLGGPFHLFFTTESPTRVAPVAEAGGGGGLTSSPASTLTSAVSSTTSGVEVLFMVLILQANFRYFCVCFASSSHPAVYRPRRDLLCV